MGTKRDTDGHTHKWSIYVHSYSNDDLSAYVSKVQFRLHETYQNHVRGKEEIAFYVCLMGGDYL